MAANIPRTTSQTPQESAAVSLNFDDEYDFPGFSEQECLEIDAIISRHLEGISPTGDGSFVQAAAEGDSEGPRVAIEIEEEPPTGLGIVLALNRSDDFPSYSQRSPFDQYRSWKNTLSVSDLTGPTWCELQYDYGLHQKRHRKIQERPDSFISGQGKVITVVKEIALDNDRTLKAGTVVHKRLEREIRPEQTWVRTTSIEETWGLRLIDMLACIRDLLDLGFCREMPVFGLIHDHVVVGVIDEVSRKPTSYSGSSENNKKRNSTSPALTPRKPKRARSTQAPAQYDLPALFKQIPHQDTSSATPPSIASHTYTLQLLDNKTRYSRGLPSDRNALPSRLQLMLYHRLLTGLVSASLDLNDFWSRVQVNPEKPFSRNFCQDSGLSTDNEEVGDDGEIQQKHPGGVWCVSGLVDLWAGSIASLDVNGVDRGLTLVYRARGSEAARRDRPAGRTDTAPSTLEELQIAQAIKESLLDLAVEDDEAFASALAESLHRSQVVDGNDSATKSAEGIGAEVVDRDPTKGGLGLDSVLAPQHRTGGMDVGIGESDILGSRSFCFDEAVLDSHLDQIFDWWRGIRPPKGVEIEDIGRCRSCEYREGCEWRSSKAREALEKVRSPNLR